MSVVPDLTPALDPMAPEPVSEPKTKEPAVKLTDEEFLQLVKDQMQSAVGMERNYELLAERELALKYYKGETPDLKSLPNRSRAVSTDVQEAVETVLPDIVSIFTEGDDVASFTPTSEQDEQAAKQETDYVLHVVFKENPGFLIFYSTIKDAVLEKTGLFKWWWEDKIEEYEESFEGKNAIELQVAQQACQADGLELSDVCEDGEMDGAPTYCFTVKQTKNMGRVKLSEVSPDDFTVALDTTVRLQETTYCSQRSRPRVQDLIAEGYDADIVRDLPPYAAGSQGEYVERARDTAGEHNNSLSTTANGHRDLRTVEVIEHYIRVDALESGQPQLWKVVTGNNQQVFLKKEQVNRIPFAAITPFITPHRFYGRSIADVLMEIQRIKTALLRMLIDSGLFSLNQRHEVATATGKANQWTVSDLLNNVPGMPVRSNDGNSVRVLPSSGLGFDVMGALEYISTLGEARSGVVRNAQGLNPDTLHDTASGAMALMGNAAKRVRLMARIMAETGVKDMFLGVHATIRENATASKKVRLNKSWVDIDPTTWGERNDMEIEIGVGSGGTQHDLVALNMLGQMIEKVIQMQGGQTNGPFVNAQDLYAFLNKFQDKTKIKGSFFSDPAQFQAPPQQPNPALVAEQGKQQLEQAKLQVSQQQLQLDAQAQAREQNRLDAAQTFDQQYKLMSLQQARELALANIDAEYQTRTDAARIKAEADELRIGADLTESAAVRGHDIVAAAVEANHAKDLMAHQAVHDHVGKLVDAALTPGPAETSEAAEPANEAPDAEPTPQDANG